MLYLSGVVRPEVWELAAQGALGVMRTPNIGNKYRDSMWAADSGCFNPKTYKGDDKYMAWLEKNQPHVSLCLFATAPDVVGDHEATLLRSRPFFPRIRALGYPVAFVSQDGATPETTPWEEFDVLFIGGTDAHKLGEEARLMAKEAVRRGMWVHMGRVNSMKRTLYAQSIGCQSVDGTYLARAGLKNLPKILSWVKASERAEGSEQMELFGG